MTQKPYGTVLLKAATILDYLAEAPSKPLQRNFRSNETDPIHSFENIRNAANDRLCQTGQREELSLRV